MRAFEHQDAEHKSDDVLAEEARQHLAASPALQLVAELLVRLRALDASWWSPDVLRKRFGASERMGWLASRPDLRQRITSKLTGLAPKAARKKAPEFQGPLLDSVVDEGDVPVRDLEDAFEPADLAVYGPAEAYWNAFRELVPMDGGARESEELGAWLLEALIASASGGFTRKPILSPLAVRLAIDGGVWHTKVPLDVRVAIDRARLQAEREHPDQPFGAADELSFATPAVLASSLSLRELAPVLAAAERAMGFAPRPEASPVASSVSVPEPATVVVPSPGAASAAPDAARAPAPAVAPPHAPPVSTPPVSTPPPHSSPPKVGSLAPSARVSTRAVPAPPPTMPSAPPPAHPGAPGSSPRSGAPPAASPHGPSSHGPTSARGGPPTTPPGSLPAPPPMHGRSSPPLPPPPPHPVGPSGTMPPGPPSAPSPSRRAPAPPPPAAPPPPVSAAEEPADEFDEVLENELESTNPWETEEGGGPDDAPGLVSRGRPLRGR